MILDGHDSSVPLSCDTDIAIVGSGPAGVAIARRLSTICNVVLIEAGGLKEAEDLSQVLEGQVTGISYPLTETRARQLGGSTALWAGYCAQFDEADFSDRAWVPDSGWPISSAEIRQYYKQTADILHIGDTDFSANEICISHSITESTETMEAGVWRFGEHKANFDTDHRRFFELSHSCDVLINTLVHEIRLSDNGDHVSALHVKNDSGRTGIVRAKLFVLAAGGLETPRLMLASNRQISCGIGNASDQVGRWFMEHPHVTLGSIRLLSGKGIEDWTSKARNCQGQWYVRNAGLSHKTQELLGILNARVHFFKPGSRPEDHKPRVGLFFEQAPNNQSRVTLANEADSTGLPRITLHWSLTDLDRRSHTLAADNIEKQLQTAGLICSDEKCRDENGILYSNHQLGTTRMSANSTKGVVDRDCKVYGTANLYIAGGSVFPTVSWANPTFTVLALALRLSDHLAIRLNRAL